jgi:hypothetical protein
MQKIKAPRYFMGLKISYLHDEKEMQELIDYAQRVAGSSLAVSNALCGLRDGDPGATVASALGLSANTA